MEKYEGNPNVQSGEKNNTDEDIFLKKTDDVSLHTHRRSKHALLTSLPLHSTRVALWEHSYRASSSVKTLPAL